MTAFQEVLTAEQEAEQAIQTARNEAAASVATAKTNQELRLKDEIAKLEESEHATLISCKEHIADLVGQIQSEAQAKVVALEKNFADHSNDLKTSLKNSF